MLKLCGSIVFVFAVMMGSAVNASAQNTDVFGRTSSGAPGAADTAEASHAVSNENSAQRMPLQDFVRALVGRGIRLQSRLNERLQDELSGQRDGFSLHGEWIIVLLSFGYGVVHALGPGHGKLVIGSYLASHRARFIDAVFLSVWSACVQALSAIVLVAGVAWIGSEGLSDVLTRASALEAMSYVALFGVGAWTLWSVATRRDCCDVDRIRLVPRGTAKSATGSGDAYLGGHLNRARSSRSSQRWRARPDARSGTFWIARQILLTGLAVGVRPCVGAIFALIAALADHIFVVGVIATFAMAAGVACTVLSVGSTSMSLNRLISNGPVRARENIERIRFVLALGGALFITLFAALQITALVLGWESVTLA